MRPKSLREAMGQYRREAPMAVPPLFDGFAAQAAANPDAIAVDGPAGRLSYQQLHSRADRVLRALRDNRAEPGAVIGLCLERSPALVASMLAVAKLGAAYLPVDPRHPWERSQLALARAGCRVVLTSSGLSHRTPPGQDAIDVEAMVASADGAGPVEPPGSAHPDDLACVFYTSGSTGAPKGVAVTGRNVASLLEGMAFLDLGPGDRVGQVANPAFDAVTFEIWAPLSSGSTVVVAPPWHVTDVDSLLRFIGEFEVTTLFLTTPLFRTVVASRPGAFAGLRHLIFGGEAADPAPVAKLQRDGAPVHLLNAYGPTETTTFATMHPIPTAWDGAAPSVPIGRALRGTRVHLLDDELRPVPAGGVGQIYLAGEGVARGYIGAPGLTADRFVPDPLAEFPGSRMYRTGDFATMAPDGTLTFVGRLDDQVKIRGNRVELAEVEIALAAQPGVQAAAAALWEPVPGDRRLVAAVVPAAGGLDFDELRAGLRTRLPEFMVPGYLRSCAEIPLNANGKVDRRTVARLLAEELEALRGDTGDAYVALISSAWEEVLRRPVEADRNFFDSGGDSLLLLQVHARLEQDLGHPIPLADLLEFPTVAGLAAALRDRYGAYTD